MDATAAGGGMNPASGFPPFFVEVSAQLGRYAEYALAAGAIARRYPPDKFPSVLDICAGPGHFAQHLSLEGYEVTGVELSSEQVESATRRYSTPRFLVGDMGALPAGPFDVLTNVYTSFGYLDSPEQDFALLRHWYSRLRPGGILVMELADLERARNRIPSEGSLRRRTGDVEEYLSFDWDTQLLKVEYVADTDARWTCFTRIYDQQTLVRELHAAGFRTVEVGGDFAGATKDPDDNLVMVACK